MNKEHGLAIADISQIRTDEGLRAQVDYANKSQEVLREVLNSKGIDYRITNSYKTILNGVALTTTYKEAKKIASLPEILTLKIDEKINDVNQKRMMFRSALPNDMIYADEAWKRNYTGKEQVIAIIDSGADPNHEIFKNSVESPRYTQENIKKRIEDYHMTEGKYFNSKIPFGFNYADRSTIIKEMSERSHGMHVAGIVAGNSSTKKGVAPDAQLLILRVFGDSGLGTTHSIYDQAIDDAVMLGADSINMSLGSTGVSDSRLELSTKTALENAKKAGIGVSIAAGNDGFAGWGAANNPKNTNPDYGILSSPSNAEISLSVASVDNDTVMKQAMLIENDDRRVNFAGSDGYTMPEDYVEVVDGRYGRKEDIPEDVEDKIVLIQRGEPKLTEEISFAKKIINAEDKKAKAVIVYNNLDEPLFVMAGLDGITIPSALIGKEDGEYLLQLINSGKKPKVKFEKEFNLTKNPTGYQISSFSSWGLTTEGNLKPDISAPGGEIYSSINNNKYDNMSGASMAAPHVASGIAIVKKYVETEMPNIPNEEKHGIIKNLLMSTAVPHMDKESKAYTSPRSQGAGLMNLDGATLSKVVVEGTNKISSINLNKIEGNTVTVSAKLHNYGEEANTFSYYGVLNTDTVEGDKVLLKPTKLMESDKKEITVNPKETTSFEITFNLEDNMVQKLSQEMPSGFFLEGFIFFESKNAPNLSVPFVGFKGVWQDVPVIEKSVYDYVIGTGLPMYYDKTNDELKPFTHINSSFEGKSVVLGEKEGSSVKNPLFDKNTIAFSPNSDGRGDYAGFVGNFFRNYKDFNIDIYKASDTNRQNSLYRPTKSDEHGIKNFLQYTLLGMQNLNTTEKHWNWYGKDRNNNFCEEGNYVMVVSVKHDSENANIQKIEFPIMPIMF
ncbi:MAG: S8 family serine peptidase [Peptoniphilaceae bacterium]